MRILSFINYANKDILERFKNDEIINIASFNDTRFKNTFYKCELGTESYVLALLCAMAGLCEFDIGELSAESCLAEEEASEILDFCKSLDMLLLDNNLLHHKDNSIYYFAKKLAEHFNAKLVFDYEFGNVNPLSLDDYNGLILYECLETDELIISPLFSQLAKIKDGDFVSVKTKDKEIKKIAILDNNLKGIFALSKKSTGFAFSPCIVKRLESDN